MEGSSAQFRPGLLFGDCWTVIDACVVKEVEASLERLSRVVAAWEKKGG
jgi:hypothetical protein